MALSIRDASRRNSASSVREARRERPPTRLDRRCVCRSGSRSAPSRSPADRRSPSAARRDRSWRRSRDGAGAARSARLATSGPPDRCERPPRGHAGRSTVPELPDSSRAAGTGRSACSQRSSTGPSQRAPGRLPHRRQLAAAKGDPRASRGVRTSSGRRGHAPPRRRRVGRQSLRGTRFGSPCPVRPDRPRRRTRVPGARRRGGALPGSGRLRASGFPRAVRDGVGRGDGFRPPRGWVACREPPVPGRGSAGRAPRGVRRHGGSVAGTDAACTRCRHEGEARGGGKAPRLVTSNMGRLGSALLCGNQGSDPTWSGNMTRGAVCSKHGGQGHPLARHRD